MQRSNIGGCTVTARDLPKEKIHPSSLLGQSGNLRKSVYEPRLSGFDWKYSVVSGGINA